MKAGDRVQIHPACNMWMRGDKFGEIVEITKARIYVKMDRSGKVIAVTENNILEVVE